ncbi:MAG TPA: preprotein translocase subunit SecG [Tepidisphaeraceae bacterium]|jgi:preprotein translocase subunit SecG|nr:preprotein translocase subunit SecG [Tepidisphaeraceae bacterium]
MGIAFYIVMCLFIFICLFLMLLVLVQKGRGGGLASAFGGGGGHTPFGTKTGDVLTWTTSIVFGIFILLAIVLNLISNAHNKPVDEKIKILQSRVMPVDAAPRNLA